MEGNGLGEIAGDVRERGEEEIPEVVAGEAAPRVEPVLKEVPEKRFVFRERHHAVANVAGRKDAVLAPQAAGTAPVVRDRDDGGEIGDGPLETGELIGTPDHVLFQAAEQRGKPRAPAQRDDAEARGKRIRFEGAFLHLRLTNRHGSSFYRKESSTVSEDAERRKGECSSGFTPLQA